MTISTNFNIQNSLIFIDGKNLVCRFQEMIKEKNVTIDDDFKKNYFIEHDKDKFIWSRGMEIDFPNLGLNKRFDIIRAYYYTFCDQNYLYELSEKISSIQISKKNYLTLNPIILHGTKASRDFKGDDIRICIDSIEHAINSNIEAFYFFTGDGSFLPLIEKLQEMGKYVFIAAFSSGLNKNLKIKSDFFSYLDEKFGLI